MQDFGDFVRLLAPALRQAAAIAHALEGRVQNRPKTGESTAVKQALTIGDTAAQEALLVALLDHFPNVRLAAEEDTPSVPFFSDTGDALVVIDPIDGTLHSYLGAEGPYAVMVGLALGGRYDSSLIALPREGLFFEATRGRGARMARARGSARPARLSDAGGRVLVSHGMPEAGGAYLRDRGVEGVSACGGAVAVAPLIAGVSAGLRYATAEAGVSIRGRIGVLIAREAGALVRGAGGSEFPSDLETPAPALLVAARGEDLGLLDDALAAGGLA